MGITITKKKAPVAKPVVAEKVAIKPADMTLEQLADRYGETKDKVDAIKLDPAFIAFAEVEKELKERLEDQLQPSEVGELKGESYLLEIGAASKKPAEITDLNLLRKMLGDKTFMEIASVTLADVRKYCNPEQLAKVLNEETGYTKTRKIVAKFLG